MAKHVFATKIQRAWRDAGIISLGCKLDCQCFALMREQRHDRVDMGEFVNPEKIQLFQRWLIKIFLRTSVPSEVRLFAKDNRILLCFFVEIFRSKFAAGSSDLVDAAFHLVANLLRLMKGEFDGIWRIGAQVSDFVRLIGVWHSEFSQQFVVQLRGDVIFLTYLSLMSKNVVSESIYSRFRTSLSMYTLFDSRAGELKSTPVYKAILMARSSKYSSFTSAFSNCKVLHEFIIEKSLDYTVAVEKTIPMLLTDHSSAGRLVDSQSLRDDLMCLMLFFTNRGNTMELVAETFKATKDCSTAEFSARVMALLLQIISSTSVVAGIRSEWDANKEHRPLETLVLAVRTVRNISENTFIGLSRPDLLQCINLETFTPTTMAYTVLRVEKLQRTCVWITASVAKCSNEEVSALSEKNPYAFHEFFYRSVFDLVLDNYSRDFLADDHMPEVLMHDLERLRTFRFEFSLHPFETRHLMEFVNSGRWIGSTPPPPSFLQMAEKFQRVLKLCYWIHGEGLSLAAAMRAQVNLS
jgi:hypothetical protein